MYYETQHLVELYTLKKEWCHNSFHELLFVFKDKEDCINELHILALCMAPYIKDILIKVMRIVTEF